MAETTRVCGLPMYDIAALQSATDALWDDIAGPLRASGMRGVPDDLTRDLPVSDLWRDPDLLLAQTCGYPYIKDLAERVTLVGTPHYAIEGCEGHGYRSRVIVARDSNAADLEQLRGKRLAINGTDSLSGAVVWSMLLGERASRSGFFSDIVRTGGHAASMQAVATGAADCAAIDCVTYALMEDVSPETMHKIRHLLWCPSLPALPMIARGDMPSRELAALRDGLIAAFTAPSDAARPLYPLGFSITRPDEYASLEAYAF